VLVNGAGALTLPGLASRLLDLAAARPRTLGAGRLVCVDGPTGAGKTVLASAVADAAALRGSVRLVHLDDLLDGWSGLPRLAAVTRDQLLAPLAEHRPGSYARYDWLAQAYAERREVEPVDLLVLEGVGAGDTAWADWTTLLVWMDAPEPLRLRRTAERDGPEVAAHLPEWTRAERTLHARLRPWLRADVTVQAAGTEGVSVTCRDGRPPATPAAE
jgi:uridine kinase